ncbi:MAG: right-handed parallel beta-helix repeat-containing protein [Syntrophales bacterium]|nr:right-handed parallel beta-helix repeat-containing protein [Syntrophales bacterium]
MLRKKVLIITVLVLAAVIALPLLYYFLTRPPVPPVPPKVAILEAIILKNYYVDATSGNDNYDGTAASYDGTHGPWKTFANIKGTGPLSPVQFNAGDKILLKRGETWNEKLTLPVDGAITSGSITYITIRDYGDPALPKPKIIGDGWDFGIYLDRNFIYLKNLNVTYINNGFSQGAVVGKGIGIAPSADPDSQVIDRNLVIDSCDVSNCPQSGISLWQRGYILISGSSLQGSIIPSICLLLFFGDGSGSSPEGGVTAPPPSSPNILTDALNGPPSKYHSNISSNGVNGIEAFGDSVKINNCYIHDNNQNGIYLEGHYAQIQSNLVEKNGRDPSLTNLDHNVYLWGNNGTVTGNTLQNANNGTGFRYSGSGLQFTNNKLIDNHKHGIGLWSNDAVNVCGNNTIANNIIYVKRFSDVPYGNMAISVGHDPGVSLFAYTNISYNVFKGQNETQAGGIALQPCDHVSIHHNNFTNLRGPIIQIERFGSNWNWETWTSELSFVSDWNNFYYIDPYYPWFDDGLGCFDWTCWQAQYDPNSTVILGEYNPNPPLPPSP